MIRSLLLLLLLATAACNSPSGWDVCDNLKDQCSADFDLTDCRQDAQRVERAAEEASCGSTLDSYLECLDDNACNWQACGGERSNLENCAGTFP